MPSEPTTPLVQVAVRMRRQGQDLIAYADILEALARSRARLRAFIGPDVWDTACIELIDQTGAALDGRAEVES